MHKLILPFVIAAGFSSIAAADDAETAKMMETGKASYMLCAACHGMDGKGMHALGAPNLTDDVWLYGGDAATIRETVVNGRMGQMPAFADKLGEQRVRLLAGYVLRMSGSGQ